MRMTQNVRANEDYLEHYGIKGMHWGIRRTPAQLGHDIKMKRHVRKLEKEREKTKAAKVRAKEKAKERATKAKIKVAKAERKALKRSERKKAANDAEAAKKLAIEDAKRREKILNSPKLLYKHRKEFDQKEIDAAIKQFRIEKDLRELSNSQRNAAKAYIDSAVGYAKSGIEAYNTAAKVYNAWSQYTGKAGVTSGKQLPIVGQGKGGDKKKKKKKDEDDDDD